MWVAEEKKNVGNFRVRLCYTDTYPGAMRWSVDVEWREKPGVIVGRGYIIDVYMDDETEAREFYDGVEKHIFLALARAE